MVLSRGRFWGSLRIKDINKQTTNHIYLEERFWIKHVWDSKIFSGPFAWNYHASSFFMASLIWSATFDKSMKNVG